MTGNSDFLCCVERFMSLGDKDRHEHIKLNSPINNGSQSRRRPLRGIGINDADYCVNLTIEGKQFKCPAYTTWVNMIVRVYDKKIHVKQPTYDGVTICDDWHKFKNFMHWWVDNQVDGWHIDKDLLSDSRCYSPETCIFVPQWLNSFITDHGASRGELPIGVSLERSTGRFKAQCRDPIAMDIGYLGLFDTPESAHTAWRRRKLDLSLKLKEFMDDIDIRIYPRVVEIINCAK